MTNQTRSKIDAVLDNRELTNRRMITDALETLLTSHEQQARRDGVEEFARYLWDNFKLDNLQLVGRWTKVDFLKYVTIFLEENPSA